MKKKKRAQKFVWTKATAKSFPKIKDNLTFAHVLALSDFNKLLKINHDACGVGVGGILSQASRLIGYFSDKLNYAKQKWSLMNKSLM